jgi:hypothetical protein
MGTTEGGRTIQSDGEVVGNVVGWLAVRPADFAGSPDFGHVTP